MAASILLRSFAVYSTLYYTWNQRWNWTILIPYKAKAVPLQAWSGTEGSRNLRFPDFMTTTLGGGKFVSRVYPPGNSPGTHFCYRLSRPQVHTAIGRIMSMTPSGIEPASFRFVAQHHNHCATAVPLIPYTRFNVLWAGSLWIDNITVLVWLSWFK